MLKPENSQSKKDLSLAVSAFAEALPGSPGEAYLAERQVGMKTAERMRLGYVDPNNPISGWERFAGRLAIPYLNAKGEAVWVKFRATPENGPDADKYAQQAGGRSRLFNTIALSAPGDTLALAEGEFDVITLTALGIPAVGIPGAQNWKSFMARCLDGYKRVVIFYDDDKPGRELVQTVKKKVPDIIALSPPGAHHDVNDAFKAGLGSQIRAMALGLEPTSTTEENHHEHEEQEAAANLDGISNPDGAIPY